MFSIRSSVRQSVGPVVFGQNNSSMHCQFSHFLTFLLNQLSFLQTQHKSSFDKGNQFCWMNIGYKVYKIKKYIFLLRNANVFKYLHSGFIFLLFVFEICNAFISVSTCAIDIRNDFHFVQIHGFKHRCFRSACLFCIKREIC